MLFYVSHETEAISMQHASVMKKKLIETSICEKKYTVSYVEKNHYRVS